MARAFFVAAITLVITACQGAPPDGHVRPFLVGPAPDAGASCVAGQTLCSSDGYSLLVCEYYAPDNRNIWAASAYCSNGCFPSQDAMGYQHDYCGQCVPFDDHECVNNVRYLCLGDGRWHPKGSCGGACACGGTHPNCRQCE